MSTKRIIAVPVNVLLIIGNLEQRVFSSRKRVVNVGSKSTGRDLSLMQDAKSDTGNAIFPHFLLNKRLDDTKWLLFSPRELSCCE